MWSILYYTLLSSNLAWQKTFSHPSGKKQMPLQFIKKRQACFIENNLICEKQLGFKPGNSCVNQLLAITHEIFSSFDNNYEVRGIFLDISRAFYKV